MNVTEFIQILFPEGDASMHVAHALKKQLLSYKPPLDVVKKTGHKSIKNINEEWLIVICNGDTPKEPVICEAIQGFIERGKRNRILTVLMSGTPDESFPEALCYEILEDGTRVEREPLAANITAQNLNASLRKLKIERLRLLAPMFGVSFDDLMNRRRRRRKVFILAVMFAALAASMTFFFYAMSRVRIMNGQNLRVKEELIKAEESEKEANAEKIAAMKDLAKSVASRARNALNDEDTELSLLLALELLPEEADVQELTEVFDDALIIRCRKGYYPLTTARSYRRTGRNLRSLSDLSSTTNYGNAECVKPDDVLKTFFDGSEDEVDYIYKSFGFEDMIIGLSEHSVSVISKSTHELLYSIHDEITDSVSLHSTGTYCNGFIAAALPGGVRRFILDLKYVYDAEDGRFLFEIDDYGLDIYVNKGVAELTKEGFFPVMLGTRLVFIDLMDGSYKDSIESAGRTVFYLPGETEEETDRPTGRIVYMTHIYSFMPPVIWCYNEEEIMIPENLNEKIKLAKELLNGRTLTDKEKRDNYLE